MGSYVKDPFAGTTPYEDRVQEAIATRQPWRLARKDGDRNDSRDLLSSLGVEIVGADDLFYLVEVPEGWVRKTRSYWTYIRDGNGDVVLEQFCKLAPHDRRAFICPAT